MAKTEDSNIVDRTGRTFWDVAHPVAAKVKLKYVAYILGLLLLICITLLLLGYLRVGFFDGRFSMELGRRATSAEIIDENIAGKWSGEIDDLEFYEFKKRLRNSLKLEFSLTNSAQQIIMKGHIKTYDTLGVFVGEADVLGQGTMERSEFAKISYTLRNETVRGFGVMLIQVDASGKKGSGFALYRRTNSENGRFGLGEIRLARE